MFLKKAIALNESKVDYWIALADAEYAVGIVFSSVEAYEKCIALAPGNYKIWLNYSLVYFDEEEYEKALDILKDGIEEIPENAILQYYAVAYLIKQGLYQEAFKYLENALNLDFEKHTLLFEFFKELEIQKLIYKVVRHYRTA